jgi:hypothetical protein
MTEAERIAVVVDTLRFLGDGWLETEADCQWARETADAIEREATSEWFHACCPLCSEVTCDDNCPLRLVREAPDDRG